MTLLVADADRPAIVSALPPELATVTASDAPDAVEAGDHELVVVATDAVVDPGGVVAAVRSAADVAVVGVGDVVVDADSMTTADDEEAIRAACERARSVATYRNSVDDLYAACRERALGADDVDVREHRREADEKLGEVPDEAGALAAAIRDSTDDG